MGYNVGANVYQGLWTKQQYQRGKMMQPGTKMGATINGESKEFIAVKLGATAWVNGTLVLIEGTATVGAAATCSGAPAIAFNQRVGVLVFSSATATQTLVGTGFGWAQVYGSCLALVTASVTLPGIALGIGAGPGAVLQQVGASASTMMHGITAIATNTASVAAGALLNVFLNYPCFIGPPDTNLA
jgi:hypothetical protein